MSAPSFILFDPTFLARKDDEAEASLPSFLQRKALTRLRSEFMAPLDMPLMRRYLADIHKRCSFLDKRKGTVLDLLKEQERIIKIEADRLEEVKRQEQARVAREKLAKLKIDQLVAEKAERERLAKIKADEERKRFEAMKKAPNVHDRCKLAPGIDEGPLVGDRVGLVLEDDIYSGTPFLVQLDDGETYWYKRSDLVLYDPEGQERQVNAVVSSLFPQKEQFKLDDLFDSSEQEGEECSNNNSNSNSNGQTSARSKFKSPDIVAAADNKLGSGLGYNIGESKSLEKADPTETLHYIDAKAGLSDAKEGDYDNDVKKDRGRLSGLLSSSNASDILLALLPPEQSSNDKIDNNSMMRDKTNDEDSACINEDSIFITSTDVSTIFWQQIGFSRCEPVWDLTQFVQEVYKPSSNVIGKNGGPPTNQPVNSDNTSSFHLLHSQTNHISAKTRFSSLFGKEEDVNTYAAMKRDLFIGRISTDVNPFKGRWRGGIIVLQNTSYFFETYNRKAFSILKRRLCFDLETDDSAPIYPFMQVAMEMTRYIALAFEIIVTSNLALKHEEFLRGASDGGGGVKAEGRKVMQYYNSHPKFLLESESQASTPRRVEDKLAAPARGDNKSSIIGVPYQMVHTLVEDQPVSATCSKGENVTIQQRDVIPEEKYMYSWRTYWHFITERECIQRLFCIGMIIFENLFHKNNCNRLDCDEIFAASTKYLQEFMVHAKSIRQIEDLVLPYLNSMDLSDV